MKPIRHFRTLSRLRRGVGTVMILAFLIPQMAVANPLGPQVVSGQASFSAQGNALTVTNSNRAIINWQNFSIGQGEVTRFIQPTAASAVLNRVVGNNPSAIYGALQSNGRVYLVNQNGIFMGPTATIDVNGLVASTLNITDSDFKAGRVNFSSGPLAGKIENQGVIRTPAGGSVYLIAPDMTNSGIIHAPNGDILLAAGKQASLVEGNTPEIAAVISAPENQALNIGKIMAEAGRIGIYGGLIRHRGIVSADSAVVDKTGVVRFRATRDVTLEKGSMTTANGSGGGDITVQSSEGTTLVSGNVEAKGGIERGGTVRLLGTRVGVIDAARIDATGDAGGGTVLVGGDYQGKNPGVQNAEATYFGKDAVIRADAVSRGDGGKVVVWSDGSTKAYGSISARGGAESGNGGLIETSGHYLDVAGSDINASAPKGSPGTWLLDPFNVTISSGVSVNGSFSEGFPDIWTPSASGSNIKDTDISGRLDGPEGGTAVWITTSGGGTEAGDITVNGPIVWTSSNGLTLEADNDIKILANISGGSGSQLVLNAINGSINQNALINLSLMSATAKGSYDVNGQISAAFINLTAGTNVTIAQPILGNTLTLNAPGNSVQSGIGAINVSKLELLGGGTYSFGLPNNIGTLAGNVGSLSLHNVRELLIGAIGSTSGLAAAGNVRLQVVGGEITQTHPISAAGLELISLGTGITLNNNSNSIGTLAASGNSHLTLKNSGPLNIGQVNTTAGLNSVYYIDLSAGGDIQINKPVVANAPSDGYIKLSSTGNISISNTYVAANSGSTTLTAGGGITIGSNGADAYIYGNPSVNLTLNGDLVFNNMVPSFGAYVTSQSPTSTTLTFNNDTSKVIFNGSQATATTSGTMGFFYGGGRSYPAILGSSLIISRGDPNNCKESITPPEEPCPTGQQRVGDICQPITCPTGQQLVGNTCQPITCPTGQELVNGTCQAITCPAGQQLVGSTCQPITCPTGQELVNGTCRAITCPTGQELVGSICQPIICPTGQVLVGSNCEPIICPTGQQLVGNICQPIICPAGQVLAGNTCQPIVCPGGQVYGASGCQCPPGTIDYAGICKTPTIVPGTDSTTVIYFPVTEEVGTPLQVLVQSIINAIDPSLFTASGSPGGGNDGSKPKKNYCN